MLTRLASAVCATGLVALLLAAAPIAPERVVGAAGASLGTNPTPVAEMSRNTVPTDARGGDLAPRQLWNKRASASIQLPVDPVTHRPQWNGKLGVKFRDDLKVRADLVPTDSVRDANGMPIPAVTEILRTFGGSIHQMLRRSPAELRELELRAERKSHRAQPDLAGMTYVDVSPDRLVETARAFNDLDIVEWIEIERNPVTHGGSTDQAQQDGCGANGPGDGTGITNCYTTSPNSRCSSLGGGNGCNNPTGCANPDGSTPNCRYGCNNTACCEAVGDFLPGCNDVTSGQGWDAMCATYANIVCTGNVYDSAPPTAGGGGPTGPSTPGSYKFDPCFAMRGPVQYQNDPPGPGGAVPPIRIQGQIVVPNVTATPAGELQVPSQLLTYQLTASGDVVYDNTVSQTPANTVTAIAYPNGQVSDEGDATTGVSQSALGDPSLEGAYLSISAGCFTNHTYGGCSQVTCCVYICRNDPYCCVVEWDDSCVARAQDTEAQTAGSAFGAPCTPQTLAGGCSTTGTPSGAFPTCTASTTPNMSAGVEKTVTGADTNKLRGFQTYIKKEAILGPFDTLPTGVTYPVQLPTTNSDVVPDPRRVDTEGNLGTLAMLNSTFRGGGLDLAGFEQLASNLLQPPKTSDNSCHGEGITVAIIEPSAYLNHEELVGQVTAESGQTQLLVIADPLDPNHGTAVLGIIGAKKTGTSSGAGEIGIRGIAYGCAMRFYPTVSREEGQRLNNAITNALIDLEEGDLMNMSIGLGGSSGDGGTGSGDTILVSPSVFTLVRLGSDVGITTIVSAGNDAAPVRTSPGGGTDNVVLDAGAIVVGACWPGYQVGQISETTTVPGPFPGNNYCRLNFSNFSGEQGTVNLSAWGTGVTTIGYGDLWNGRNPAPAGDELQTNKLRSYTALFNGTSASSAMITGWATCVQSFSVAYWGAPLGAETLRAAISRYDLAFRNVYPQCGLSYSSPQFPGYPENGSPSVGDIEAGGQQAQIGGFPNCRNTASYVVSNTFGGTPVFLQVITGTLESGTSFSLRERDGAAVSIKAIKKRAGTRASGYGTQLFYPLNGDTTDLQLQLALPQPPQAVTNISLTTFSQTSWSLPVVEVIYFYNWKQRRWTGAGSATVAQTGTGGVFQVPGNPQDYAIANSSGGTSVYARVYTCGLGSTGYTVLHDLLRLEGQVDIFNPGGGIEP